MTEGARHLADGDRLFGAGSIADAIAAYDRALAAQPGLAAAHFNRAVALARAGRVDDAVAGFRNALAARPGWTAALLALGHVEFRRARHRDAEGWFERAAATDPASAEAHCNLGLARLQQLHPARALPALSRARELAPGREEPWWGLRRAYLMLGREPDALADFLRFEPGAQPSATLIAAALETAHVAPGDALERRYLPMALGWSWTGADLAALASVVGQLPYFDVAREDAFALCQTYDRLAQASRAGVADLAQAPADDGSARLRIGYLSADFRAHVMGRIVDELLARHDAAAFDIRLYSLAPPGGEDALTQRMRERVSGFARLSGMTDWDAARGIAADRLHVLVDLMGQTSWAQPGILLFKPAPVIVTHLGYHGSVGLRQVDFKITDAIADLPDAGAFQVERPLPMAASVIPIRRVAHGETAPAPRDRPVAFGAFVGLHKTSPRCLAAWKRILDRVPEATLVFSPHHAWQREFFVRRLESFGIAAGRVGFVPHTLDEARDRERYAALDVALDAFPYTGGDSAACAIAEGVPFVTRCGERHCERVATSLLSHLGVTDTVAHSDDEYVEIAVWLAQDRAARAALADRIRAALPDHDAAMSAYVRSLEAALVEAWRRHGDAAPAR